MRVHELAKELGVTSKEILATAKGLGKPVKSASSRADEDLIDKLRKAFASSAGLAPVGDAPDADEEIPEEVLEEEIPKKDLARLAEKQKGAKPAGMKSKSDPIPEVRVPEDTTRPAAAPSGGLKTVEVKSPIVVKDLAESLGMRPNSLIAKLMGVGVFASINQNLDDETARRVAKEFGYDLVLAKLEKKEPVREELPSEFKVQQDKKEDLRPRSPVVTFMGHVDHGKTSLLDHIRKSRITAREAGGMTQHIGAYQVRIPAGSITFLDTPGHKAFTAMRARGAKITDIVVLVVAADDGVMPQTKEAIDHCREAKVPLVVAVNKCDLPGAAPEKVRRQLAELGLQPEDWGGETIFADVSAKTGEGIDHLLEMLHLQAEIMELRANPNRQANGVVVEAKLTKGRGATMTVLVHNGTLRVGDPLLSGVHAGKVKALISDEGVSVREAGPAVPVEVLGLDGVPEAGAEFYVTQDERQAKRYSQARRDQSREESWGAVRHTTLEDLYREIVEGETKELKLIIKGDVQGSVEALIKSLEELGTKKVAVRVIHAMVGDVNESDVMLATASNAVIIAFHCKSDAKIRDQAKKERVEIRTYRIIYDAVEDVRKAMEGMLDPKLEELVIGHAHVRKVFDLSKSGKVAGCFVRDGKILRNGKVRLLRNGKSLYDGQINSLKRFKDEVREVKSDFECGIKLASWDDIVEGDIIEAYLIEKTAQVL